ncbi:MAG: reverse transcriptase domain-containing protein, partial [Saprospiraceae bacterium]
MRFTFDDCTISKLTKMKPELKANADPCYAKPRRMSLEQLQWLEKHVTKMVDLGMLKAVRNPIWGVPVFVVTKPGGKGFRMVADFRAVNSRCLSNTLPMPLLEQLVACTKGAKFFGSFDNMKGFNLLGVENSEPFTLVTPFGCYQMNVAPQGYLNSPVVYQDRIVNEVLNGIHGISCCNWIDDCLLFAATEEEYLDRLDDLLSRYLKWDVKLNFAKCDFFAERIIWCGREFSEHGYCYDPKYYDKVLATPEPLLAIELHDFLFAVGWIQDSLEPFGVLEAKSTLTEFLNKLFEWKAQKGTKSRKKKSLVGIKLKEHGWSTKEVEAFQKVLKCVHEAIRVAVPDSEKEMCLFTDASESGCSIVVTQTYEEELDKPVLEQKHNIVFMTTHKWSDSEKNWHISSQEAYPIVFSLKRLDYLFAGRRVNIFMDHKNLEYIFNPEAVTSKTVLMRLQRWALEIQSRNYCIRHISGEDNLVADLFSRWALDQRRESEVQSLSSRLLKKLQAYNNPGEKNKEVLPGRRRRSRVTFDDEYEDLEDLKDETQCSVSTEVPRTVDEDVKKPSAFAEVCSRMNSLKDFSGEDILVPTYEDIKLQQEVTKDKRPPNAKRDSKGLFCVNKKLWIPSELAPTFIAIAHGINAHPGINTMRTILDKYFWIQDKTKLIKDLNS